MRTLLLFDGLGGTNDNLLQRLRGQYAGPENSHYFQVVFDTLDEVTTYLDAPKYAPTFPDGLTLRRWLDPKSGTTNEVLHDSIAAGLCIYVHQACQVQPTRRPAEDSVVAALGHSIGLLAALVAGLRLRRTDEFLQVVAAGLRLAALTLVRGQRATEPPPTSHDLAQRYRQSSQRGGPPGPMAALVGPPRDELRHLVAEFNRRGAAVSLSLANSPQAHVLSGPTTDLLGFYFAHEAAFRSSGATWAFLTNTIPFHSPQLAPAAATVAEERGFIGPFPGGDQLRMPVYATDGPRNLQESSDLVDEFLQQVLLRPIEWEIVTRYAVTDSAIDHVVDCGPGAAARRFTKECLKESGRRLRFESMNQFSTSGAQGGQHAMSTLSRAGRTA